MKLLTCVSLFLGFAAAGDWSLEEGRADYKWLKNPSSARELSLSGAGLATASVLGEVTRAPHGFGDSEGATLSLNRLLLPNQQGMAIDGLKLGYGQDSMGFWLESRFLSVENLQGYDEWGNPQAEFGAGSWQFGLGTSYKYLLDFGASVHWLHSQIDSYSSDAFLLNGSIGYTFPFKTQVAFGVQNLGWGNPYIERTIIPPMRAQWGLSHKIDGERLSATAHLDGILRNDEGLSLATALTIGYLERIFLHLGGEPLREHFLPSAGVGLKFSWISLDYGFGGHEYLGGSHLVELGVQF